MPPRPPLALILLALLCAATAAPAAQRSIFDDDDWVPPEPVVPTPPVTDDPGKAPATIAGRRAQSATGFKPLPAVPDARGSAASLPAAAVVPASRRRVPAAGEPAPVRKLMNDLFAEQLADHSPAGRRKLAETSLARAETSADAPVDQFVLLAAAGDAAADAAALPLAVKAAPVGTEGYGFDSCRVHWNCGGL